MKTEQEKIYTARDIYALPEGERAEVIDGKFYPKAYPDTRHQILLGMFPLPCTA